MFQRNSAYALPTYLLRVCLEVSSATKKRRFTNRQLVVVGQLGRDLWTNQAQHYSGR